MDNQQLPTNRKSEKLNKNYKKIKLKKWSRSWSKATQKGYSMSTEPKHKLETETYKIGRWVWRWKWQWSRTIKWGWHFRNFGQSPRGILVEIKKWNKTMFKLKRITSNVISVTQDLLRIWHYKNTTAPNILRHTYTWKRKVKLNTSTVRLVTQYLFLKLLYRNIPISNINLSTNSKNVQFVAKYFGMDPKIWTQRSWQDNIQWEV